MNDATKKTFEVRTPDGRSIRHLAETIDVLKARLSPGYAIIGEGFGCDHNGQGGYVVPLRGKSLLLESHGDELRGWLDWMRRIQAMKISPSEQFHPRIWHSWY